MADNLEPQIPWIEKFYGVQKHLEFEAVIFCEMCSVGLNIANCLYRSRLEKLGSKLAIHPRLYDLVT